MILNEAAVKAMNFDSPIGQTVKYEGKDWHVVGVVKDFVLGLPFRSVQPMIIGSPAGMLRVVHIKLNHNNRMADNLAQLEQIFRQHNPAYALDRYIFVDEDYARKFQTS